MYIFRIRFQAESITLIARCSCNEIASSENSFVIHCSKCGNVDKISRMSFKNTSIFMLLKTYEKKR